MPSRIRRRFWLAGVVFVVGALVVDNLAEFLLQEGGIGMDLLDESPEFSGLVLLVDAIPDYLSGEDGELILKFTPGEESARD